MQGLYNFVEASPKRHALFQNTEIDGDGDSSFIRILKSLSVTRWAAHYDSIKAVDIEYPRVVKCVYQLSNDSDSNTSSKARALLISVLDFEFLMGLAILKIILPNTSKLNSYVQSPTIDIRKVKVNAELTIQTLEKCRTDEDFDLIWDSVNLRCSQVKEFLEKENIDFDFKEARQPRKWPQGVNDLKSYQKITYYFPAFDRIITELTQRFAENDQDRDGIRISALVYLIVYQLEVSKS